MCICGPPLHLNVFLKLFLCIFSCLFCVILVCLFHYDGWEENIVMTLEIRIEEMGYKSCLI